MQKTLAIVITMLLLVGLVVSGVSADASASQQITICVMPIDVIGVVDPIELINPGETGETDLKWSTNTAEARKIFVRLSHVPTGLRLKVEALTAGTYGEHSQPPIGAGEVVLDSTEQHELISAVWAGAGGCKVRYTAEVVDVVEQGVSDVAEVSFILTTSSRAPLSVSSHQLVIGQGLPLSQGENAVQSGGEVYYVTITDTE